MSTDTSWARSASTRGYNVYCLTCYCSLVKMKRGRPSKRAKKNISGLRNQPSQASTALSASPSPVASVVNSRASSVSGSRLPAPPEEIPVHLDSLRVDWAGEDEEDNTDVDDELDDDGWDDEEFGMRLAEMAEREDGKDSDWIPAKLKAKIMKKKGESSNIRGRVCSILICHCGRAGIGVHQRPRCHE